MLLILFINLELKNKNYIIFGEIKLKNNSPFAKPNQQNGKDKDEKKNNIQLNLAIGAISEYVKKRIENDIGEKNI